MTENSDQDKICDVCGEKKYQGYKRLSISGMGSRESWNIRHQDCYQKIKELIVKEIGEPSDEYR